MQFKHVRFDQRHMATDFSLTLSVPAERVRHAEFTLLECHQLISQLELEWSEFIETSPVAVFNRSANGVTLPVPDSLLEALRMSALIENQTEGKFSCLAKSQSRVSFPEAIKLDLSNKTILKQADKIHLGLGAIGKGIALDKIREILEREGFSDYVINAGGSSILLSGYSAPNEPWRWAWSWRKSAQGEYFGHEFSHRSGNTVALGISGTLEQGKHLVDPSSQKPVSSMESALVAHNSAAYADALSTALFVAGWERGVPLLSSPLSSPAVACIECGEVPRWNQIFAENWGGVRTMVASLLLFIFTTLSSSVWVVADDDIVDLSELGIDSFNPYLYTRNDWWILFPLVILFAVIMHLPSLIRKRGRLRKNLGVQKQ